MTRAVMNAAALLGSNGGNGSPRRGEGTPGQGREHQRLFVAGEFGRFARPRPRGHGVPVLPLGSPANVEGKKEPAACGSGGAQRATETVTGETDDVAATT